MGTPLKAGSTDEENDRHFASTLRRRVVELNDLLVEIAQRGIKVELATFETDRPNRRTQISPAAVQLRVDALTRSL